MTARHIECKCDHGHKVYQFCVDTDDGLVCIRLCQDCYNQLKGSVLQDVINEAVRSAAPLLMRRSVND
jgi:hypothetical protein